MSANNTAKPMTDAQILKWLCAHLEWDGRGYWLPEICIVEAQSGDEDCPEPTIQEFRQALRSCARSR